MFVPTGDSGFISKFPIIPNNIIEKEKNMQELLNLLLQEQKHLEEILTKTKIEVEKAPEGHLRISRDKKKLRYYHCMDNKNEVYIPKENTQLPRELAQKSYNISVIKKAERQLRQIQRLTSEYSDNEVETVYESLTHARKAIVTPIEQTWEQVVKEWYDIEYIGKEFQEGMPVIMSEKGERVRSKSEKILADYFYRKNIRYKYEKPLYLNGMGLVYPDFTFISPKTRKEIYWEHEGMMDKADYAKAAIKKIEAYEKNDIFPGERLILTFETQQNMLNSQIVEKLVEKYL